GGVARARPQPGGRGGAGGAGGEINPQRAGGNKTGGDEVSPGYGDSRAAARVVSIAFARIRAANAGSRDTNATAMPDPARGRARCTRIRYRHASRVPLARRKAGLAKSTRTIAAGSGKIEDEPGQAGIFGPGREGDALCGKCGACTWRKHATRYGRGRKRPSAPARRSGRRRKPWRGRAQRRRLPRPWSDRRPN